VGYEKLFNPALQYHDEQAFVDYILADQPETPFYFAVMKRVNKVGPDLMRELASVDSLPVANLPPIAQGHLVIDTSAAADFAQFHVPGTINIPSASLVQWAGFLVDYGQPVYLLTAKESLAANLRGLRSIGIDNVGGYFDDGEVQASGLRTESYRSATPRELRGKVEAGDVRLLDVRAETEFREGHIVGADHRFLGTLLRDLPNFGKSKPIVAQCLGGGRSAIATSILQRAGYEVTNMQGGYRAWREAGLPIANQ
jgi:hydroxyacylglutathione hydrolase